MGDPSRRHCSGNVTLSGQARRIDPGILGKLNDAIQRSSRTLHQDIQSCAEHSLYQCRLYVDRVFYGEGMGTSKKAARIRAAHVVLDRLLYPFGDVGTNVDTRKVDTTCTPAHGAQNDSTIGCNEQGFLRDQDMEKDATDTHAHVIQNDTSIVSVRGYGVDLDSCLIERAKEKAGNDIGLTFECLDMMETHDPAFKVFCKQRFNLISCLSVTMWVHLHHGDDGLFSFLQCLSSMTEHLLIEPQPWKCYR